MSKGNIGQLGPAARAQIIFFFLSLNMQISDSLVVGRAVIV